MAIGFVSIAPDPSVSVVRGELKNGRPMVSKRTKRLTEVQGHSE
jgi:hypothetical protein